MDKTNKGQFVVKAEAPLNNVVVVDTTELALIEGFIAFIRKRQRGVYSAEIVSHNGRRYVSVDYIDKDRIELNPVDEDIDSTEGKL